MAQMYVPLRASSKDTVHFPWKMDNWKILATTGEPPVSQSPCNSHVNYEKNFRKTSNSEFY